MTAQIISVVNQKGGAGKSTVTMAIAGAFGRRGLRVLVVDADLQNSSMRWAAAAADDKPFPATVINLAAAGGKLHREIKAHLGNYDRVLVDCPPTVDSPVAESILLVADFALVPVPLSPTDLWSTQGIVKLIERAGVVNERLRGYLLPNRVQRTLVSTQLRVVLNDFGLPVLKSKLGLRAAYQEAAVTGSTIAGLGGSAKAAAAEVEVLTDEIEELLKEPAVGQEKFD
jgi:chromosome partitioning protein